MNEDRKKELKHLITQQERIETLKARISDLRAKCESQTDPEHQAVIAREMKTLLDELIPLVEEQGETGFLKMGLLITLEAVESDIDKRLTDEETARVDIFVKMVEGALDFLEDDEIASIKATKFYKLASMLMEIGKWLPMMSIVTGKEDGYLSGLSPITQYIQSVMHREKSGQGGRKKAEEERKAKLETIKPFLDELKQVRFTGQFKTCRRAVDVLLARDERFLSLADNIENGKISYDNFLIPEAKKIWNRTIRLDRPK